VRHQRLGALRELVQKPLRIERAIERPREGGHAPQEIGQPGVHEEPL
jgi:hypothetical protein